MWDDRSGRNANTRFQEIAPCSLKMTHSKPPHFWDFENDHAKLDYEVKQSE